MNRRCANGPGIILMLDIDHFKRVNDAFGHRRRWRVRSVAQVLRDSCRVYDVAGRYAGEEFCVVLPRDEGWQKSCERIERMARGPDVGQRFGVVTASIGIAGIDSAEDEGTLSPSTLIDRADRALLRKHLGATASNCGT